MGETQPTIHSVTESGIVADHIPLPVPQALVAPTHSDEEHNTIKTSLVPLACWRANDMRFEFESSFVLPEIATEIGALKVLIDVHTLTDNQGNKQKPTLSVFGHADPVGNDELNKAMSGRRAAAIYAMLCRRAEVWEDLYSNGGKMASVVSGDAWGIRSIQRMLNALEASSDEADDPSKIEIIQERTLYEKGWVEFSSEPGAEKPSGNQPSPQEPASSPAPLEVNNKMDDRTRAAVRRFQASDYGKAAGLAIDGDPGPETRKALFLAYMDNICVDGNGEPFSLDHSTSFLGQGVDQAGKADYQGCSEFNPVLVFSKEEQSAFDAETDHATRNAQNAPNRRVVVLLFRPGVKVSNGCWPCPRATEGVAACRKRFWSNGSKRRSPGDLRREFGDTFDTFACRFYQRLTTGSPCEKNIPGPRVPCRIQLHDSFFEPCANQNYVITGEGGFFDIGTTNDKGIVVTLIPKSLRQLLVRYASEKLGMSYAVTVTPVFTQQAEDETRLTHLRNIGFGAADDSANRILLKFQAAHEDLDMTGEFNKATREAVDQLLSAALKDKLGVAHG